MSKSKTKVIKVDIDGNKYTAVFTGSSYTSLQFGGRNNADSIGDKGNEWSIWFKEKSSDNFFEVIFGKNKNGCRDNKPLRVIVWGNGDGNIIDEYEL